MHQVISIGTNHLDFATLQQLIHGGNTITLAEEAVEKIQICRSFLDDKMLETDQSYYGINTGFGYLQNVKIDKQQLQELQENLIKSHACGMGEEVPDEIVRMMLVLKIKSLSYGHSGVQVQTVQRLVDLFNNNIFPVVFTQGSLGASGDLAPLSHLCLPLIGEGCVKVNGVKLSASELLNKYNWNSINLQSKEGLALINGTQFMSAYGIYNLVKSERLLKWANIIAALSFDGFDGVLSPFNENIHKVRAHAGQIEVASTLAYWLRKSEMATQSKTQVQDPYSFRCIPQVHGASLDAFNYVKHVFITEINSVTDNPNIFPAENLIISGGNFHGQPLALTADFLSIAMSEIASISERRTYQLISGQRGLPLFLVKNSGLHSGFMIPQYTAAGIVSENKQLCTPSSVDTIPSSNNQEDHVSMGANGVVKCYRVVQNVEKVLAIELLTAAQAIDFRKPLKTSPALEKLMSAYRQVVSFNEKDRILHDDMMQSIRFLQTFDIDSLSNE